MAIIDQTRVLGPMLKKRALRSGSFILASKSEFFRGRRRHKTRLIRVLPFNLQGNRHKQLRANHKELSR